MANASAGRPPRPGAAGPFGNPFADAALVRDVGRSRSRRPSSRAVAKPAIGGPLYPPVHALLLRPARAHRAAPTLTTSSRCICPLMVFVAGLGCQRTDPRPNPVVDRDARAVRSSRQLAPGSTWLRTRRDAGASWSGAGRSCARGYHVAGGVVWGLFAFKPVWGLAFFLVPVLDTAVAVLRRDGRSPGAAWPPLTLPFVGVQTWLDWLAVGKEGGRPVQREPELDQPQPRPAERSAAHLARLQSLPEAERDTPLAKRLAWTLWGVVLGDHGGRVSCGYADRRRATGVGRALPLPRGVADVATASCTTTCSWSAAGCAVLFAEPRRFLRTRVFALRRPGGPAAPPADRALDPPQPPASGLGSAGWSATSRLSRSPSWCCCSSTRTRSAGMDLEGDRRHRALRSQ